MRPFILCSLLLFLATSALASDGVLEINQTCAVETGCFSGDTAEFPVTLASPGSYALTSDLTAPTGVETDVVVVTASNVTLNLNGFTIFGATQGFADSGVAVFGDNVEVWNGTIRFSRRGVYVIQASGARLIGLRIHDVRTTGIEALAAVSTTDVRIDSCTIGGGFSSGIDLRNASGGVGTALIVNTTSRSNLGVATQWTATLRSNVVSSVTLSGTLVELGPNQCGTNTVCP